MNEEVMSALLDGECSPSELDGILRRLDREPGLREQLARLSLAREARRGLKINPAYRDLASRVRAGLPAKPDAGTTVVTPMSRAARAVPWRPVAALAAAAAFGAVAVLALKPQAADTPLSTEVAAAPAVAAPAALSEQELRDLRRYQMSYSQGRAEAVGGTLGYARYAAYEDSSTADGGR